MFSLEKIRPCSMFIDRSPVSGSMLDTDTNLSAIIPQNKTNFELVKKLKPVDVTTDGHAKDSSAKTLKAANRSIDRSHPNTKHFVIQQARKGNH